MDVVAQAFDAEWKFYGVWLGHSVSVSISCFRYALLDREETTTMNKRPKLFSNLKTSVT